MSDDFFSAIEGPIPFGGLDSADPLSFKVYDPDRLVLGKRMADHLRIAICLWHSFNWPGSDVFGVGTFENVFGAGKNIEIGANLFVKL